MRKEFYTKYKRYSGFAAGFLVSSFLIELYQDFMGKERYIQYVQEQWVNTPWWLWVILIILVEAGHYHLQNRRRKEEHENTDKQNN